MFKNIENLKIENIHKGTLKSPRSVVCRKGNSFVLRTAGAVRYTFEDYYIDVHAGEIIFLPEGSSYDLTFLTDSACEYVSIRFKADLTDARPSSYSFDGFREADEFINNMTDLWKFGGPAEQYRCYAIFYNLLAYIDSLEKLAYMDRKKFKVISPAVTYLKKHIYDCDLKVEDLIKLCGISDTYFEKIFKTNYGTTPQKYILSKRLSHAKSIIDSGDFDTISEVAVSVGYCDPLYFSRAFKKKYGVSPTHILKDN